MKVNGQSPFKCSQNYSCSHAKFKCNSSFTIANFYLLMMVLRCFRDLLGMAFKMFNGEKTSCDGQKGQLPEATLRSPKTMGHRRCHLNCGNANH